ncbi:MAG: hypothetical protein ACLUOF_09095 [Ruminococcus sp.]
MIRKMTHHPHHRLGERNLRIGVKIWLFFMLFVCVVFLLMWLFQVIFLEWFYESMKIRDTAKLAQLVSDYGRMTFRGCPEISCKTKCALNCSTKRQEVYNCIQRQVPAARRKRTFFYLIDLQTADRHDLPQVSNEPKSDAGLRLHHVRQDEAVLAICC